MDQASLASIHESKTLAGIFQHIVDDCRGLTPVIDDFLGKSSKLAASLRSTVLALSSFLDSLHKIAERAANTKGSSRDLGGCLTKVYIRHRAVEAYLNTFASSMTDGLFVPLKAKNEDFRRRVSELDRDHLKEFKKVRSEIKRKIELIHKLRRKSRKESNGEIVQQIEQQTRELYIKYRVLEEQERQAVRRINMEERAQFCGFAACLKPVLSEELAVMSEIENIGEMVDNLATIIRDPHVIPDTTDQVIQEIITSGNAANYSFATPPSSPGESLFSSRCGSLKSISSLVNSRTSSPASLRSTEVPPVILRSSNSASNNNPKNRLSSISMQSAGEERGRACPSPSFYSEDEGGGGRQGRERQSRPARPNSTCELYSRFRGASSSPSRHCRDQPFSTVKRTHSPFRRAAVPDNQRPGENYEMLNGQTSSPVPLSPPPMQGQQRHSNPMSQHERREASSPPTQSVLSRRPPLPRKLQTGGGEAIRQMRTTDSMELGQDTGPWQLLQIEDDEPSSFSSPWSPPPATSAPCWTPSSSGSPWSPPPSSTSSHADYAAPRCLRPLRLPDFTPARQDMVLPQPMTNSGWEDEDELQTPTVEEQNFPDSKVGFTQVEDTVSTVSSTSSGYGSQQRESDPRWPARSRQQPVSSLHWPPPASSHLWSEAIMARKLADLGSTRLSRQTSVSSEDRPRGLSSLNSQTDRARATLARSLSFGQPGTIASSCRLSRLENGRRSASLVDRKVEERQKERDSVLQLLNLRLGGRPGQPGR